MNAGPDTLVKVRGSASGSLAETTWSMVWPARPLIGSGCARTGGLSGPVTVISSVAAVTKVPSLATIPAFTAPWSASEGAKCTFPVAEPVPGLTVVTVMYAGPNDFENVIGSPSPSVAWRTWSAVVPPGRDIGAGWTMTGATPLMASARSEGACASVPPCARSAADDAASDFVAPATRRRERRARTTGIRAHIERPPVKCASFPDEGSSRRDGHRRSFPSEITRYPRKWNDCESVRDGPQERTEIPLLARRCQGKWGVG